MSHLTYLTFNDCYSGIFQSQVIDVVTTYNKIHPTRLLSFVPLRRYFKERKTIKANAPNVRVWPMIPGSRYWLLNKYLLQVYTLLHPSKGIVARGPFAANLALSLSKAKVCYDGRGAITAEYNEYEVSSSSFLKQAIFGIEQKAVLNTQARIAVSQQLIEYWQEQFNYTSNIHQVIPCCISKAYSSNQTDENLLHQIQQFTTNKTVFIYSGSVAKWQSFEALSIFFKQILSDLNNVLLFLSPESKHIDDLNLLYEGQVKRLWVDPKLVSEILKLGHFGILLRSKSITNKVASPTKFAEYLAAGLRVIISDEIGDYSKTVQEHDLGVVLENLDQKIEVSRFVRPSKEQRKKAQDYAHAYLFKEAEQIQQRYEKIVDLLL